MIKTHKVISAVVGAFALGGVLASTAQAAYPEKPVTVILPNKTGGAADINLRILVKHLKKYTDAKVIVKNIPGGGTTTGTRAAYDAPKDGYTMMFFHQAYMGTAAQGILGRKFSDMTPVARTGGIDIMYVASKNAPFDNLKEMVAYAKANPKVVKVGVYLTANSHLVALSVMDKLGVELKPINIPGGGGPIRAALIGGQIDLGISLPAVARPYIEKGDMKPLVFFADYKPRSLPTLPTAREAGYPDLLFNVTNYWWMHKDAPSQASKFWADKLEQVMKDPDLRDELGKKIEDLRFSRDAALAKEVKEQYDNYEKIVEKFNLKKK